MRVFASEGDARPRLVGEDRIEHTPVGGAVTVNPGEAFDITVLRRQTDFVQSGLPQDVSESSWSIEVKNARDKPATVRIVEVVPGDWTMLAGERQAREGNRRPPRLAAEHAGKRQRHPHLPHPHQAVTCDARRQAPARA